MILEISIPTPGESITEVVLANWLVEDGSVVSKNQEVAEVESDKATLPLIAEKGGKIKFLVAEGETVAVGTVACTIDTSQSSVADNTKTKRESKNKEKSEDIDKRSNQPERIPTEEMITANINKVKTTPLAKSMMEKEGLSVEDIINGLKKITTKEVQKVLRTSNVSQSVHSGSHLPREIKTEPMSQLRRKLSKRLVSVKNETAMLTTFNEVDMSAVMAMRTKYQKQFIEKHGLKLGYMSVFTKAASVALQAFPKINSYLDGDSIVTPQYADVAIAVQTDKGLMVPVVRNTESKGIPEIEKEIAELAKKARSFRLSIDEMSGGTFTITNGGVFGSMLSTPIINPPQSGILGMHNIVERPVAVDGRVEIRPIMYLALSYDHRIVDGRDSVSYLVKVKELIEAPYKLMLGSVDEDRILLGL